MPFHEGLLGFRQSSREQIITPNLGEPDNCVQLIRMSARSCRRTMFVHRSHPFAGLMKNNLLKKFSSAAENRPFVDWN